MESSLLDTAAAAASLCAAPGGRRRAGSTASFLSCSCSPRDCRVSSSYSHSISRMLSGVRLAARRKLFRADPADLLGVANWPEAGGAGHQQQQHWWAALEHNFVLESADDEYGGVVVDADRLPTDKAAFARSLAASLSYWKSVGKKGVWLKLPVDRAEFVPLAVKEGFKYHHAEESYLMMTYWIPDEPNMLPANASHQVGVGGFVINDQMEVLVLINLQSQSDPSRQHKPGARPPYSSGGAAASLGRGVLGEVIAPRRAGVACDGYSHRSSRGARALMGGGRGVKSQEPRQRPESVIRGRKDLPGSESDPRWPDPSHGVWLARSKWPPRQALDTIGIHRSLVTTRTLENWEEQPVSHRSERKRDNEKRNAAGAHFHHTSPVRGGGKHSWRNHAHLPSVASQADGMELEHYCQ